MQQQNKATAQPQSKQVVNRGEWHASDIAGPDPCNSAIKKIAGKQIYLKDKPEALILLQAAEIERLTNYLNDYKCKYRSISRQPLDRQSYETQIKELFQRDTSSKLEIDRLNTTIQTITITGEQYKKQLLAAHQKNKVLAHESTVISDRYAAIEKSLKETRENYQKYIKKSQFEISSLNTQLSANKTYIESILKNNNDLIARVNTIPNIQRRIFELETQNRYYVEQLQNLNKDLSAKKQKLINQQRGYSTLYERHSNLQQTHQDVKKQLDSHTRSLQMIKNVLSSLQAQHEKVKDQHDTNLKETINTISKRANYVESLHTQLSELNQKLTALEKANEELRASLANEKTSNTSLKQDITKLSEDIRLKQERLSKNELQINTLKQSIKAKQLELVQSLKNQKSLQEALTNKQKQISIQLSNIAENHSKQITLFKESLQKKDAHIASLSHKLNEHDKSLHLARGQLLLSHQIIKTQQVENEQLAKTHEQQLRKTLVITQTLKSTLKQKSDRIAQLQSSVGQYKGKEAYLESKINGLSLKNDTLNKKLADQIQKYSLILKSKAAQSQAQKQKLLNELKAATQSHAEQISKLEQQKSAIIVKHSQLKDRHDQASLLHSDLQSKHHQLNQENTNLKTNVKQLQHAVSTITSKLDKYQTQKSDFPILMNKLTINKQVLNKKVQSQTSQIDNKQKEVKVLQQKIKSTQSEYYLQKQTINKLKIQVFKFNTERSCYIIEIKQLKDKIQVLDKDITHLKQTKANNQQEIAKLKAEREQLSNLFQNKTKQNEGLKRKMIELQSQLRDSFESALKQQKDNHSKAYSLLVQQKQELNKKIGELEPHLDRAQTLQKHNQHLQINLKTANSNSEIQRNRSITLSQDNQALRKAIVDKQTKLKEYYEHQLQLKAKLSQQQIDRLIKDIQQLKRQKQQALIDRNQLFEISNGCQSRITLQMQQIERLHTILNNNIAQNKSEIDSIRATNAALQNQINNLSKSIEQAHKKEQEWTKAYKITTKRIAYYQQFIQQLQSEFIEIKLRTAQLRQERDLILKKNDRLIRSIRTLNSELDNLQKQGDSLSKYFTKQSSIHKGLNIHFGIVQDLFNKLEHSKVIVEEKTVQIQQVASK